MQYSFLKIFIYLSVPGLSCGTWDPCHHVQDPHCSMRDLQLRHTRSLVVTGGIPQLRHSCRMFKMPHEHEISDPRHYGTTAVTGRGTPSRAREWALV